MASATTGDPDVVESSRTPADPAPRYYLEIFLVSFSGLLLEISYTRIISFKLFYYFVYLVLGLALLGLGAGGVIVAISERLRRATTEAILMYSLLVGAAMMAIGYLIVALAPINTLAMWKYGWTTVTNGGILLLLCLVLFVSFVPAGIALSTLFGRRPEGIGRLYFADLAGAALACGVAVSLMASTGPPAGIMLAALAIALPGARLAWRVRQRWSWLGVVLVLILAVCVASPGVLPDVKLDKGKASPLGAGELLYSSWSPVFRVDVRTFGSIRALFHDGLLGSEMLHWNGEASTLASFGFNRQPTAIPFSVESAPPANELIIGAAAGHEVVASLYYKAAHVDAVELNPVTYKLVTKTMADYDGHLAQNPAVHYVNADGRSYLARSNKKYDLIWYPAPDSYSATNASSASAFVLSESYLYTTNAIVDSIKHLAPGGVVVNQFGDHNFATLPTRTARYVQTVRNALQQLGIPNAQNHILVSTTPGGLLPPLSTILVKATPFTTADIDRFDRIVDSVPGSRVAYAPGQINRAEPITRFIVPSVAANAGSYKYSVGAISDNKPFFWHYTTFAHALRTIGTRITGNNTEVTLGERVLLLLLAFATLLSAVFLLLPFVFIRKTWRRLPRKRMSALYFISIGLGFIFFEITMIQKLVLFLGYPTYSLTVTLSSLLIFVGIGSLLSSRLDLRGRSGLLLPAPVAVLTIFYLFGTAPLTDAMLHLPLAARIPIAFAIMAPLGLCLGLFMPSGVRAIADLSDHSREYIAWGWALNGFASVIGSVLATMLAMTYGFQVVLVVALGAYCVAGLALQNLLPRASTE
jgi:hypothetical protein